MQFIDVDSDNDDTAAAANDDDNAAATADVYDADAS